MKDEGTPMQWLYSHIVMFCSLVRLPGRRMCAQLIGTFYLITSYVLLSIKISSAVSGEQLASYLLVWTFELDFGSPLGCWARLIYPQPQCSDQWASAAATKHWRLASTLLVMEIEPNINERIAGGSTITLSGFILVVSCHVQTRNHS